VVYFNKDILETHYNFWDDPVPHAKAAKLFLVRQTFTGIDDNPIATKNTDRELVKVFDIQGREVSKDTNGSILIYLYDDETREMKFILDSG